MFPQSSYIKEKCSKFRLNAKVIAFIILIYLLWPAGFAARYEYIKSEKILSNLVPEITRNLSVLQLSECKYGDIIGKNEFVIESAIQLKTQSRRIFSGGESYPEGCRPKFSSAIIVPYRQRALQLRRFLQYMHSYLRKQRIHYKIYVVEQNDTKPFNRAKLLNIGSVVAASHEFPCLIFHDVDLLPLNLGHLYACSKLPRHMCANLNVFRYNLPYRGLFGGVVSIRTNQFQRINGMSNMFSGWGGEDDDFYGRIRSRKLDISRFDPSYSEYIMMGHKKETPNKDRLKFLSTGPLRYYSDGLNSLQFRTNEINVYDLYTHVLVET